MNTKTLFLSIAVIITSFFFYSCGSKQTKTIEGDLFIKMIGYNVLYNLPDSVLTDIEKKYTEVNCVAMSAKKCKEAKSMQFLIKNNLLRSPYILLQTENKEIKSIYLSEQDFEQFKGISLSELQENKQKVAVVADVDIIKADSVEVYVARNLKSVQFVEGETPWKK